MLTRTSRAFSISNCFLGACAAMALPAVGCSSDAGGQGNLPASSFAGAAAPVLPASGNTAVPTPTAVGSAGGAAPAAPPVVIPTTPVASATAGTSAAAPPMTGVTPPTNVEGTPTAQPTEEVPWPADCETHYKLMINSGTTKSQIPAGKEVHPQSSITPPWKGDVQAVAFRPITDNARVLHHWILYAAGGEFLTGWAPGADENAKKPMPADVGMYLPATGNMRMDVHYNNLTGTKIEEDNSGVEVCVISTPAKFRKNTATVVGILGNASAPAHKHVDNATTCTVQASMGTATLVSNSPHMHQLGVHAKLELKQGGVSSILHDADFTFDNQHAYGMDPRVVVKTGDQFTVTCSYTNDTDRNVTFGQNTEDEMCFNFVSVYPKGGFACR
jgi:hypothetical protein